MIQVEINRWNLHPINRLLPLNNSFVRLFHLLNIFSCISVNGDIKLESLLQNNECEESEFERMKNPFDESAQV